MISVCMATYNGERFIKEQIDSILPQLSKDDELIISDDVSTDRTLEIIASYNDERIKVFHHQKNPEYAKIKHSRNFYYATSNFENALKRAKGDYIFLSDQDDIWMPNKVQKMIPILKEFDCVMSNNQIIDVNGKPLNFFLGEKQPFGKSVFTNIKRTPFLGCCMAFSRKSLDYILPFPRKLIGHDLWMGALCAYKNSLSYIDEPLHEYRFHENSVSPSVTANSKNPFLFKIKYRIVFLIQFYKRILLKK
ncbi:glycosyltransferase [uncultured Treponema sp.]|uniref:glycosyltransferase n=1 Tax=uncultured Treponema sp. TaxID=162155 RepID=UPI0025F62B60|nr:glycosyltransferase [uncultured Treponema sp.]